MHIVEDGLYCSEKEKNDKFLERVAKKAEHLKKLEELHNRPPTVRFSSEIRDTWNPLRRRLKAKLEAEEEKTYGPEWVGKMKTIHIVSESEDSSDEESNFSDDSRSKYFDFDDSCDYDTTTDDNDEEETANANDENVRSAALQPYYDGIWNEPYMWFQPHSSSKK